MEIRLTISNQAVTIVPVIYGQRVRQIRESLNLAADWNPDSHTIAYIGDDYDYEDFDDLELAQPEWAQALRDANVDTSKIVAVIEIH